MSRGGRRALAFCLTLTLAAATGFAEVDAAALLVASDPFRHVPENLRVELAVSSAPGGRETLYEIWRRGDERLLVRFLAAKDRGKFVVRRDDELFFLAPGSRRALRLAPALAPLPATLFDELLRLRLARDYEIGEVAVAHGQARMELTARPGAQGPARLRWVVDLGTGRPLRVEILDPRGRVARQVVFRAWSERGPLAPAELVAKDIARGALPVEIRLLRVEEPTIPEALFDLEDRSARAALPPPAAP